MPDFRLYFKTTFFLLLEKSNLITRHQWFSNISHKVPPNTTFHLEILTKYLISGVPPGLEQNQIRATPCLKGPPKMT